MTYNVIATPKFAKELKKLAKKYPSIIDEYSSLITELETNSNMGSPLGKNCYKIRLAIKSKGKGKSGGARVITNFVIVLNTVYLLAIYDKSDKNSISNKELLELLDQVPK